MKLEYYRKLFEQKAKEVLQQQSKEELITEVIERFSIKDWKDIARK